MDSRLKDFTDQFLTAHQAVINFVEQCTEEEWTALCIGENEPVGAVANHIAVAYRVEISLLSAVMSGDPIPEVYANEGELDQFHAEMSSRFSSWGKEKTLANLVKNGENVYRFLCQLRDDDLERTVDTLMIRRWFGVPISIETFIQHIVIGHPYDHLRSMQKEAGRMKQ